MNKLLKELRRIDGVRLWVRRGRVFGWYMDIAKKAEEKTSADYIIRGKYNVIAFGKESGVSDKIDHAAVKTLVSNWRLRKKFMDVICPYLKAGDVSELKIKNGEYIANLSFWGEVPLFVKIMERSELCDRSSNCTYILRFPIEGLKEFVELLS